MTKLTLLKAAVEIIVSVGVGAIISNAVKATTPANVGFIKKLCIGMGALILTGMVTDSATKYTEEKITETTKQIKNIFEPEEI